MKQQIKIRSLRWQEPKVFRLLSPIIALCNHHPYTSYNHKKSNGKEEPEEPLGHSDRDSSHHILCIVHGLFSVHQQTWNLPHGYASASVRPSIGVLWWTVLGFSASQHHWHLQTPLILWEHFPRLCLEILLTARNILIINTNWNDKMTKETN